ncbi:MAG: hypothetical protein AB7Q23_00990 [Hyphomonadaceae bacterium]
MPDDGNFTIKLDPNIAQALEARARKEGVTPEQYIAEVVSDLVGVDWEAPPPDLIEPEDDLRASLAEQLRQIESGEAELIPHDDVMREMRAIVGAAKASKP